MFGCPAIPRQVLLVLCLHYKKNRVVPCGIILRRNVFSHRPRKLLNSSPPLHRGHRSLREGQVSATHQTVAGPGLSLYFENERRGSFFNPGRNSLPTGDWTRDQRGADRSSSPLRCKPLGNVYIISSIFLDPLAVEIVKEQEFTFHYVFTSR
jgi:hypothetical protein